jgi:hypothetical protein
MTRSSTDRSGRLAEYRSKRDVGRSGEPVGGSPHAGLRITDPQRASDVAVAIYLFDAMAQIGFSEWTRDGRLRHPRFLGLREDKPASDVVREEALSR